LSGASPSQLASTFGSGFFLLLVRLNLGFVLRETYRCAHHTFLLGFPTGWLSTANQAFFWCRCRGERGFLQGESLASNLLLCYCFAFFLYFIFACIFFIKNTKKLVPFIVGVLLLLLLVHSVVPKYVLEDLSIGSGSIIGKDNNKEFINHVSKHKDVEDRSLVKLAPSYEVVAAYLVHMLEARFVNLNPFMQQMFLKLHDIEDSEKRDFILETLRKEFRDVVIEARKVFERFNMLGSRVDVVSTNKEEIRFPHLSKS
jgi:hypothetical protein